MLGISRRQGYVGQDFDELSRIAARSTLGGNIYEVKGDEDEEVDEDEDFIIV